MPLIVSPGCDVSVLVQVESLQDKIGELEDGLNKHHFEAGEHKVRCTLLLSVHYYATSTRCSGEGVGAEVGTGEIKCSSSRVPDQQVASPAGTGAGGEDRGGEPQEQRRPQQVSETDEGAPSRATGGREERAGDGEKTTKCCKWI